MRFKWVLAALVLLNGCWLQIGNGPGHTRFTADSAINRSNVATLQPLWSVDADLEQVSEPMVWGDNVYVSDQATGMVRAYQGTTGAPIWSVATPAAGATGATMTTYPVVVGDQVWAGGGVINRVPPVVCKAAAMHLDARTGAVLSNVEGPFPSPAAERDGIVVEHQVGLCGALEGQGVLVRDAQTQQVLWRGTGPRYAWPTPPAVTADSVLVEQSSQVFRYPAGGCGAPVCEPTWVVTFPDNTAYRSMVAGDEGTVYMNSQGNLLALDEATGAEQWRGPIGTGSSIALAHGTVYVAWANFGQAGHLAAYAAGGCGAATCAPLWTATFGTEAGVPTVAGDLVYVGGGNAVLAFPTEGCGAAICPPYATIPLSGGAQWLSISDGRVYAAGNGRLTALEPTG